MLAFLSTALSLIVHVPARARSLVMSSTPGVEVNHEWATGEPNRNKKTRPRTATAVADPQPEADAACEADDACVLLDEPIVEQVKSTFELGGGEALDQSGDWAFCKEPPIDPNVTCFLASEVDYLEGEIPEGQPWLCTTSDELHTPITQEAGKSVAAEDSY